MWRAWLIALAGCRIGFSPTVDGQGDAAQTVHSELALDRIAPNEPLLDFPLLVLLDDTRVDRGKLSTDAADLRFYSATGDVLAHEIDELGASGGAPLLAWVRVPRIEGTAVRITMAYGDPAAPRATVPVWSTDYRAVWHLASLADSAGDHDAAAIGPITATGVIGDGCSFDASLQHYLRVADHTALDLPAITISGWIYVRSMPQAYAVIATRELGATGRDDFMLGVLSGSVLATVNTAVEETSTTAGTVTQNTWHHLAFTLDGTWLATYLDGAKQTEAACAGTPLHSANPVMLGAGRNNLDATNANTVADIDFLDGLLDEVRIEATARSPAWMAYQYLAMRDEVISYGPSVAASSWTSLAARYTGSSRSDR